MEKEVSLVSDLETDGLLKDVSTIHCLAIHDLTTKETFTYDSNKRKVPIYG